MALQNYASYDPILSQVAADYLGSQALDGLAYLRQIPAERIATLSGVYPKARKGILEKTSPRPIGPDDSALIITPAGFDTVRVALTPQGARVNVSELERIYAAYTLPQFDIRRRATELLTVRLSVWWEDTLRAAAKTALTSAGRTLTPTTKWDASASDPVQDVENLKKHFLRPPNVMIVPYVVHQYVRNNAAVKDRVKYVQVAKPLEPVELAALFDVDRYVVARWYYYDPATDSFKDLYLDDVLLAYLEPAGGGLTQSAFFYVWNGNLLFEAFNWVEPGIGAKAGSEWLKLELTASDLQVGIIENAYLLTDVLSI